MMVDTLEKMQAAGLADDEPELTPQEETEVELVLEGETEPEAVVAEGDDDTTIELQGDDQDHPKRVEVPKRALSELRRTRREAREQVVQRDAELDSMRAEMQELRQIQVQNLKKPLYADFIDDASYDTALLQYHQQAGSLQPQQEQAQGQQYDQRQPSQQPDMSDAINAHIDRAEKLGVKPDKFIAAERTVRSVVGDMVTDALITHVGIGSEKAMMILGTRPQELARVQQLLASDPTGLSAVSHVARLAERAKVNKKTISDAPRPTVSPSGGAIVTGDQSKYAKQSEKAEKAGDVQKMVDIRRAARKAGVTL
jgi:hypothetical protein